MRKQMAIAMASLAASAAVLTFAYIGVANAGNERRQLTGSAVSLLLHEGMSDAVPDPCLKDGSLRQAETIYECSLAAMSDVRFVKINLSINMRSVAIASDLDEDVWITGEGIFDIPERNDITLRGPDGDFMRLVTIGDDIYVQVSYGLNNDYLSEWQRIETPEEDFGQTIFSLALPEVHRQHGETDGARWSYEGSGDGEYILELVLEDESISAMPEGRVLRFRLDSETFRQKGMALAGGDDARLIWKATFYDYDLPTEIPRPSAVQHD